MSDLDTGVSEVNSVRIHFGIVDLGAYKKQRSNMMQAPESHSKSFAFYLGDEQIYEKKRAVSLHNDLSELNNANKIEEIKIIDSNPRNNPQPPKNGN